MSVYSRKFKIIDLFAGAGGLSNGFEQTGRFEVVGAVENNIAAARTYIQNHIGNDNLIIKKPDTQESDITQIIFSNYIRGKEITGDKLIVIGGPPCQGFSNANRQKNYVISGNNQLVKEFVRAIDEIRPEGFLMENVKTMDSDTHKFFVTKHINHSKFAYSSLNHLKEVMEKNGETIEELIKEDYIVMVETTHPQLGNVFEKLIELEYNKPLIESAPLISRLRSIKRASGKSNEIQLKKQKEIKGVLDLISQLKLQLRKSTIWYELNVKLLIEESIKILDNLIHTKVRSGDVIEVIEPLFDLNQFLMHYKELSDEKIDYSNLSVNKNNEKIQIQAEVKSYNVVKYLQRVFPYFGYKIDSGVLDASDFGVPQVRKRFMILGVKENSLNGITVKLPKRVFNKVNTTYDAISDLEQIPPQNDLKSYNPIDYLKSDTVELSPLQQYFLNGNKRGKIYNHVNTNSRDLSLKRFEAIKDTGGKNFHSLSDELKSTYTDSSRTQNTIYLRLKYDKPSPTVVNVRKSMWNHPKNAVALSIREAARLQSFRDNYVFYGTKDQQYQQIGNAVPPLLARAVAEKMLECLGEIPLLSIEDEFNLR